METIEAVIGEGGVLHVVGLPFETGSRIDVTLKEKKPPMTQEEWRAHLERARKALAHIDFEAEDPFPEPVEPLDPTGDEPPH